MNEVGSVQNTSINYVPYIHQQTNACAIAGKWDSYKYINTNSSRFYEEIYFSMQILFGLRQGLRFCLQKCPTFYNVQYCTVLYRLPNRLLGHEYCVYGQVWSITLHKRKGKFYIFQVTVDWKYYAHLTRKVFIFRKEEYILVLVLPFEISCYSTFLRKIMAITNLAVDNKNLVLNSSSWKRKYSWKKGPIGIL